MQNFERPAQTGNGEVARARDEDGVYRERVWVDTEDGPRAVAMVLGDPATLGAWVARELNTEFSTRPSAGALEASLQRLSPHYKLSPASEAA